MNYKYELFMLYTRMFLNTLSRLPLPRSPHLQRLTESASVREGERQ